VLPFLKEVLSQREAAVKALSDWKRAPHGVVRVGAGAAFTSTVLPLILKRFRHRFPEVALYVEVGNRDDLIKGLEDGLLDLTFELDYGTQQHSDLAPVATWSAPLNFIAAASRRRGRCTMKELESAPFISYASGSRIEAIIQHYFDECRFRPRVVMRSDSAAAIIAMVKDGVGVSMAFLYAVHAELRTGQIRTISVDMPPLMARMSLIKLRSSYTPRALGAFIELTQSMALPCMKLERV
jgi:DNA-binding transcriptional LysR family regulator